jgi:amino acid transporter
VTPAAPAVPARPALVRAIGRWDLTAAVVNAVIGSAVFGMPARLAELTGAASPLAALVAGLGVLTIVLCFAEVASRFQDAGGPYLYARESFGPFVGFEAGWLSFWIRVTSLSANLNVFVTYCAALVPWVGTGLGRGLTMSSVVGLVTVVNVLGVRPATWNVNFFTLAKLSPLMLLVLLGLPRVRVDVLATQTVADADWTQAVLLLMFAYGGFETALFSAGEAKNPRRDTGFALLTALAVIAFVYLLVQIVVVGIVPHVAGEKAPVAAAFRILLGAPGATLASLAAMISVYGYTNGVVLQSPRLLFSMSERGELPRWLSHVHPTFRTPAVAIVTYSLLALVFALYGTFEWNVVLSAIVRLVTYGLTCAALPVFRLKRADDPPGFRLPAAWLVVPLAIAFCVWLLSTRTFSQAWILLLIIVVGAALFLGARLAERRPTRPQDD